MPLKTNKPEPKQILNVKKSNYLKIKTQIFKNLKETMKIVST
jgi:hypothetical protein